MSMGSGPGCDVEYVFGCDILGTTKGHIPRHAKKYRDFQQEFDRLQQERENAFQEFYDDVHAGSFPEKKNIVEINENELDIFLNKLEQRS
jgi:3-methyl-2-oxobutanoate hydroxymethyltransferase